MHHSQQQLLLFQQENTFHLDNFIFSSNAELQEQIRYPLQNNFFLYASKAHGKTHLLHAIYRQYLQHNRQSILIPLSLYHQLTPEILDNLDTMDLICVDDLQYIAGNEAWEVAFYQLYNQLRQSNCKLVITADKHLEQLGIGLKDLYSRLQWGINYSLRPLDDADKIKFLVQRAHQKSLALPENVARYIVNRVARDMSVIVDILEQLEYLTLEKKSKLSIAFVKKYLKI